MNPKQPNETIREGESTRNAAGEKDWLEASDWDDPLQVAIVYKSFRSKECGHAVQWMPHRLVDSKACPVCQEPVSYICNGGPPSVEDPFVCFKFGKQIYRLSLKKPQTTRSSQSTDWLSTFLAKWLATTASPEATPVLAQDRIRWALNLGDGFKILQKGKVLYPSTNSINSTSPREISRHLVELSYKDEQSSAPSLVVMGTLLGRELPARPPDPTTSWTWKQLFYLPFAILYWSIHSTWAFTKAFLAPFLPQSMLGDTETRRRPERDDRPHDD